MAYGHGGGKVLTSREEVSVVLASRFAFARRWHWSDGGW